jgi:hypothetical protein
LHYSRAAPQLRSLKIALTLNHKLNPLGRQGFAFLVE